MHGGGNARLMTKPRKVWPELTAERLRELMEYDPETGVFKWRRGRGGVWAGTVAGTVDPSTGYVRIYVDQKNHHAHRLAWLHVTGAWPEGQIDHRDLDRANNRFANLRPATNAQNMQNASLYANNKSGYRGVSWSRGSRKWWVQVKANGVHYNGGYFDDVEEAAKARDRLAEMLHGEFVRLNG
jgi:HNH endonuclease/AP2 domain